jgi:hypothetical protein
MLVSKVKKPQPRFHAADTCKKKKKTYQPYIVAGSEFFNDGNGRSQWTQWDAGRVRVLTKGTRDGTRGGIEIRAIAQIAYQTYIRVKLYP